MPTFQSAFLTLHGRIDRRTFAWRFAYLMAVMTAQIYAAAFAAAYATTSTPLCLAYVLLDAVLFVIGVVGLMSIIGRRLNDIRPGWSDVRGRYILIAAVAVAQPLYRLWTGRMWFAVDDPGSYGVAAVFALMTLIVPVCLFWPGSRIPPELQRR